MADFGDTTGMQNPIFKIMQSQAGGAQNSQGMGQNPMNLNPNSMQQPQMGMNQMGNQMGNNQMPGMDMNNQQQQQAQQPGMNLGTNQMPGQPNPMAQMGMGNNMPQQTGVNPMAQMMNQSGMNPQMAQQMNPQMNPQMMGNNGAMMGNNGAMMGTSNAMDMNQMMQQQLMAQQMMQQQQMMAAQQAQAAAARQTQMNNILNSMGQGQGNNPPMNQTMPQNQAQQPSGQGFSVIFRASGDAAQNSAPVMIQCMPHEKVSELIERYRNKTGDRDPQKKFIFNAKNLAPSLSLSEAGISNNANIFVVATKGIKGAF